MGYAFRSPSGDLHGGGSGRNVTAPRNSGGPAPAPTDGRVRVVPQSASVIGQVQGMIQSALAWRNLVQMLWIEAGRPPVPGFPASRVQQILWGELPPEDGFFSALLGALTSRSRAGSGELSLMRNLLRAHDRDTWHTAHRATWIHVPHPESDSEADMVMVDPDSNTVMAVQLKDSCLGSAIGASAVDSASGDEGAGTLWDRMKLMFEQQPDPGAVETEAEFMAALRQLKEITKLSLRQIEEHSKTTAAGWLPRSSAADMLRRETLPKPDALWALTAALGLTKEDQDKWEAARSRLYQQRRTQRHLQSVPVEDGDPGLDEYQSLVNDDLDAQTA